MVSERLYLNKRGTRRQKGIRTVQHLGAQEIADTGFRTLACLPVLAGESLSSMRINAYAIAYDRVHVKHAQWINWGAFFTPFAWGTSDFALDEARLNNNAHEFYLQDVTDHGGGVYTGWGEPDHAGSDHLMEYANGMDISEKENIFLRQNWMAPLSDGDNVSLVDRFQTVVGRGKNSYYFKVSGYITFGIFLYANDAEGNFAVAKMDDSMSTSEFLIATNQATIGAIHEDDEDMGDIPKQIQTLLYGGDTYVNAGTLRANDNDEIQAYCVLSAVFKTPYPRPLGEW